MMNDKTRLIELIKEKSFRQSGTPSFPLSSGKMSPYYFNLKAVTTDAEGGFLVGSVVFDEIQRLGLRPRAIGGLTMGADPIALATAFTSFLKNDPIQAFMIRKEPKPHGLGLQIEGNIQKGDRVVIIDDVVTTGTSTIKAMETAKKYGLTILAAIVLVDRCEENGKENIEAQGVSMHPVFTIKDFV
jgi:orotate phosphoribosyltransferase